MKQIVKFLIAALLIFKEFTGLSQGINLNFESANVPPSGYEPYGTFVPIGSALPGWTAYLGANQITQVGYNSPTLGTATVSLIGPTWNSNDVSRTGVGIIDGDYSVAVQSGAIPVTENGGENASIAQNVTVPSTAESLQFEAYAFGPFSVSFAGDALDPVILSYGQSEDGLPYALFGANLSAWAGHTGQLEFTADYEISDPYIVLDNITFSTNSVAPEPSIVALTAIGGLLFGTRKWFARR